MSFSHAVVVSRSWLLTFHIKAVWARRPGRRKKHGPKLAPEHHNLEVLEKSSNKLFLLEKHRNLVMVRAEVRGTVRVKVMISNLLV